MTTRKQLADKEHLLAVIVKYLPATNSRGSRVKLHLPRFEKSKLVPFDHQWNTSYQIAEAFLMDHGITCKAEADLGDQHLLLLSWDEMDKLSALFNI